MKMRDIDFLIIGAAKCATTWLQVQLQANPSIYMPAPELHYFSRKFDRGDDWYTDQFDVPASAKLIGEKSNTYLSDPKACKRIHDALPDIKLIAQLRNPIDRAYSDYCMLFRRGKVGADIETYLDPNKGRGNRFLESGNYADQLEAYIDLYGRDAMLILDFHNVAKNPTAQLDMLYRHLNQARPILDTHVSSKVKDKTDERIPPKMRRQLKRLKPLVRPFRKNKVFEATWQLFARKPNYPELTPALRSTLYNYYIPSMEKLENIAGWNTGHWV